MFETRYAKNMDEDAKILALQPIMPENMLFGPEGDRSICTQNCAQPSSNNLDDEVPVSMRKQGPSS